MAPLVHRNATLLRGEAAAQWFTATFAINGWSGARRDPVPERNHYHMNSHEVLGLASGQAEFQFGGPSGAVLLLSAGDVVVLPAGCAQCCLASTEDLLIITATPGGFAPDHHEGGGGFAPMPMPARADPVLGPGRGFVAR